MKISTLGLEIVANSDDFHHEVISILKSYCDPTFARNTALLYVAMVMCADERGFVRATDAEINAFVNENRRRLMDTLVLILALSECGQARVN